MTAADEAAVALDFLRAVEGWVGDLLALLLTIVVEVLLGAA